jgi:hypothetical protein
MRHVWFQPFSCTKFAKLHIPTSSPSAAPLQFGFMFARAANYKGNGGGLNSRRAPQLAHQ